MREDRSLFSSDGLVEPSVSEPLIENSILTGISPLHPVVFLPIKRGTRDLESWRTQPLVDHPQSRKKRDEQSAAGQHEANKL